MVCAPVLFSYGAKWNLLMNDILVPTNPAELIDQIIDLQLRIAAAGPRQPSDLLRRREVLSRLAARIMPPDEELAQLTEHLVTARSDLFNLTQDLRACDARNDYGTAFVALSQSLLAAMAALDAAKAAINDHVAPSSLGPIQRFDA